MFCHALLPARYAASAAADDFLRAMRRLRLRFRRLCCHAACCRYAQR